MMSHDQSSPIESKLKQRQHFRNLQAILSIILGLPLVFIAPLILGAIFWFVSIMLLDGWYHWGWFFLALTVITVPLLFRLEIQSAGDYLGKAMKDAKPLVPHSDEMVIAAYIALGAISGIAVAVATDPRASSAGLTEIFLTGPRMVLSGFRYFRQTRYLSTFDIVRAERIVTVLLAKSRGVEPELLRERGEPQDNLWPVLLWLAFYGWIGVSEKRDKIFLYSESREILGP